MSINTTYSGILNIDKPPGLTSHDIVSRVRRVANMKKVGHAGTLDPLATGVLLVMLGKATRLMEYAHDFKKIYLAEITLGVTSDTDDALGTLTTQNTEEHPSETLIKKTLADFTGDIKQIPPSYAAIKVKGKKLYEYARLNQTVEKKPRPVTLYNIELLNYTYPTLNIRVTCSSGTYIRSLARDVGEAVKTGAHLSQLKREAIGHFNIKEAVALEKLTPDNIPNHLISPEKLVTHLTSVTLSNDDIEKVQQGKPVMYTQETLTDKQIVSFFDNHHKLIGIGFFDSTESLIHPKKILS